ncbi:Protein of unknown function (DUF429) [Idiomarina sp. A28L]|uniref:DUF429 domain-containing protein n=1 Tax=Idiomarina sp. A28L TaxID=1036674 RepID=UPI0002138A35|nr:DUF429 domain-containing protein [Idiomarina sp. A28L]EGN75019.1 Protein of unknown function (DUF429) [Idiomarina sp. A28L]
MNLYLGFDPGGEKQFGWSISSESDECLVVHKTGNANHAVGALEAVRQHISDSDDVIAVGIDAPLFWVANGGRAADKKVRDAIKLLGARSPSGTVQQINSLRGACLVQGAMIASLIAESFPEASINESHPKAFLFLLGLASSVVQPSNVTVEHFSNYIKPSGRTYSEHERDAILGCIASWLPARADKAWRNLAMEEESMIVPGAYEPNYWMPWELIT